MAKNPTSDRPPMLAEWPIDQDGDDVDFVEAPEIGWFASQAMQHHDSLLNAKIVYLFVKEPSGSGSRKVVGKAKKSSKEDRFISGVDAIVRVAWTTWVEFSDAQRLALVDHELCHLYREIDTGKVVTQRHDLEEFVAVIQRHGFWNDDLKRVEKKFRQMRIPFPDTKGQDSAAAPMGQA